MKRNKEMKDFVLTSIFGAIILVLSLVPFLGYIQIGIIGFTIIHVAALIGISLVSRKYAIIIGFIFGLGSWIVAMTRPAGPFDFAFQYPWISILPRMIFAYLAHLIFTNLKKLSYKKDGNAIILTIVGVVFTGAMLLVAKFVISAVGITSNTYLVYLSATSISLLLIFIYYLYTRNKNASGYIIAGLSISTIIHTILVLSALAMLVPKGFYDDVLAGGNETLVNIMFGIAMSNGGIEILVAILIGTPIIVALNNYNEKDDFNAPNIWCRKYNDWTWN